jgi:hypothetical protein
MEAGRVLANGFYPAVVESVWPKDGPYGEYWEWNFRVETVRLKTFTSGNLKHEKTRSFVEAMINRSVDPTEELSPSYFGGEHWTVEVGTIIKNGRAYNSIQKVI